MTIQLPNEIDTTSLRPRVAIGYDTVSGVHALADRTKRILIVGTRKSAAPVAANVPTNILRNSDGADYFGDGFPIDLAVRAARKANPRCQITAVAVDEEGGSTAAAVTVTFANNANADCACTITVGMRRVVFAVHNGDTPTVIATAARDAINADVTLGFTAARTNGVLTITWKTKGTSGNTVPVSATFSVKTTLVATTITLGAVELAGGATDPEIDNALAACASQRFHLIVALFTDDTNGGHLKDYLKDKGGGEIGFGQLGIQVINSILSDATGLADALNAPRNMVYAIKGCPAHFGEIAGAVAGVMASETDPARPYNTLELVGITAPAVENRWIDSEQETLLTSGCAPLVVGPGDTVRIQRAVSTYTKNASNITDRSLLDVTTLQCLDAVRDDLTLMFTTRYGRSTWAEDDDESRLPASVARPKQIKQSILETMRVEESLGIVQKVEAHADDIIVEKVGADCHFEVPVQVVDGLQAVLGKLTLVIPFAA